MKKFNLLILLLCMMLSGCKEYGEKRIVSTVVADTDKVKVYYYDFSQEKPSYIKEEGKNNGLKNTLADIFAQNDYSLKLCKYAVVSEEILDDGLNKIFFALTDGRFAPDIVVLQGDTDLDAEEYAKIDKDSYPIYNYNFENNSIDGIVENISSAEKNIIIDNKVYKKLNLQQSFVFDIISNVKDCGKYLIYDQNELIVAELYKSNTFYCAEGSILNVNIKAVLKNYRGMPSGEKYRESVCDLLENDIKKQAEELLKDKLLTDSFDLLWYRNTGGFNAININVNII